MSAAAASVIAGFAASAAFAATSFLYAATAYVVWPLSRKLVLDLGIISSIAEPVWENALNLFTEGGFFSRIYGFYTYGGVSASFQMLKPTMLVLITMILLVRFTLSRRIDDVVEELQELDREKGRGKISRDESDRKKRQCEAVGVWHQAMVVSDDARMSSSRTLATNVAVVVAGHGAMAGMDDYGITKLSTGKEDDRELQRMKGN
ncbi:hypothetical protein ZIOFF_070648 [Zingiber officinale]|uniref:Uncharacterized protein n=1 Tax=Zingiber officinale TaxID=94328 RepID=A0A8J5C0J0_ZINOF|nr:hypothetical protein ZIOFF_070648 [Zingiber officinale]